MTWDAAECTWDAAPNAWDSTEGPCGTTTTEPTGRIIEGPGYRGDVTGSTYSGSVGNE